MKQSLHLFALLLALAPAALAQPAMRNGDFRSGGFATVSAAAPGAYALPVGHWTVRQHAPGRTDVQLVRGFNPAFDPADNAVWVNTEAAETALVQAIAPAVRAAAVTASVYVVAGRAALCLGAGGAAADCAYTTGQGRWETLRVTGAPAGDDGLLYDEVLLQSTGAAQFFADDVQLAGADAALPAHVALEPNYPNPFNPSTMLRFALPERMQVRVDVFDATGRLVQRLFDDVQEAGSHVLRFDAADLPSGTYFVRLAAGRHTQTRPVTLVR